MVKRPEGSHRRRLPNATSPEVSTARRRPLGVLHPGGHRSDRPRAARPPALLGQQHGRFLAACRHRPDAGGGPPSRSGIDQRHLPERPLSHAEHAGTVETGRCDPAGADRTSPSGRRGGGVRPGDRIDHDGPMPYAQTAGAVPISPTGAAARKDRHACSACRSVPRPFGPARRAFRYALDADRNPPQLPAFSSRCGGCPGRRAGGHRGSIVAARQAR
jgi:hypothetical protein